MPLIIPGERNLTQETFGALILGLQENRIREEERDRQEAAADAGGGDLGGALGSAAGIAAVLLAAPTGGASLALLGAGAAIGGGAGRIIGSQVDPPGKGFPGGRTGQFVQGLNQATQGLLKYRAIEASEELDEDEKDEAFLTQLQQDFGPDAVAGFDKAQNKFFQDATDAGRPEPSRSDFRRAFNQARAGQIGQSARRFRAGIEGARAIGKDEAGKLRNYRQNFDKPGEIFKWTPGIQQRHEGIEAFKNRIETDLAAGKITPEEAQQFRSQLRKQQANLSRDFLYRAPKPIFIEDLQAGGKQPQRGDVVSSRGFPEWTMSVTDGGAIHVGVIPGTLKENKTTGRLNRFDAKGGFEFAGQRIGGVMRLQGEPFVHPNDPTGTTVYFDPKGEPQLWPTGKDGNTAADAVGDTVEALLKQTDIEGQSVILKRMEPRQGETPEDAQRRVATMISGVVGAQMDAERLVERGVELAAFARQWRGAPDFATVYAGLKNGDDELKKLDGVLEQLQQFEASGPLPARGAAIRRGAAKRILFKLQSLEFEVSRLSAPVRDGYIRMVANLTNLANRPFGVFRTLPGAPVDSGFPLEPDIDLSPR